MECPGMGWVGRDLEVSPTRVRTPSTRPAPRAPSKPGLGHFQGWESAWKKTWSQWEEDLDSTGRRLGLNGKKTWIHLEEDLDSIRSILGFGGKKTWIQ